MENQVKIFENEQLGKVRVVQNASGEPLFCANDVCTALGYSNGRDALARHVDGDDVVKHDIIDSIGRSQEASFVTESGLYALIFGSTLPTAKEFKHWVTNEILPSIRKTGSYTIPQAPRISKEELELRQAEVKERTAQIWMKLADKYNGKSASYEQVLDAYATKALEGKFVLPLPITERETFSATEIGKQLGISANMVGKITNNNNLKTSEFGEWFVDKSRSSNKEVETFRYFNNVIPKIKEHI